MGQHLTLPFAAMDQIAGYTNSFDPNLSTSNKTSHWKIRKSMCQKDDISHSCICMYKQYLYHCTHMEKPKSKYCTCLYHSANALSRIMTKISDEEFAVIGLGSSYAFLLMTVNEKQGITPTEISQHMQLTPSTVTRLIEKMEYRGFLKRESIGRSTEVYSTETGLALQSQLKTIWQGLYKRYSDILGKDIAEKLTSDIYTSAQKLE